MKVLIISCSKKAYELGERLKKRWEEQAEAEALALKSAEPAADEIQILHKTKTKMLPELSISERIEELVEEQFSKVSVIVFLCATGIAVRSIAPLLRHKSQDPAVLVMDETGRYCISLLSGHAGGANFYAHQIADLVGAEPVITTATDREGKFAVDVFARNNGLKITDWKKAKDISVAVLSGEPVGFASDVPVEGVMPKELVPYETGQQGLLIWITNKKASAFSAEENSRTLRLILPNLTLGIGCRKGTEQALIEEAVKEFLAQQKVELKAVSRIASIDLKAEEPGLLGFCRDHQIPFAVYSSEELSGLEGDYTESAFVKSVTGVSNVCERAAAFGGRKLLVKKTCFPQVTVAMSEESLLLSF